MIVFLDIFYLLLALSIIPIAFRAFSLFRNRKPRVIIIIGAILLTIGTIWSYQYTLNYIDKRDAKLSKYNLCEYYEQDKVVEMKFDVGITAFNVNFRENPDLNAEIIEVISEGELVKILPQKPVNKWYPVGYNGKSGWIHCEYLRPVLKSETHLLFKRALKFTVDYAFPEGNLFKKIIGFLGGIVLGLFFILFGRYELILDKLSLYLPILYFAIKNAVTIQLTLSLTELALSAYGLAVVSLISYSITSLVVKVISPNND